MHLDSNSKSKDSINKEIETKSKDSSKLEEEEGSKAKDNDVDIIDVE